MARQRYSISESWNRILRLFKGQTPSEPPGSLTGEFLSENQAISDLAELFANSLPGYSLALPQAWYDANVNAGFITGSAGGVNVIYNISGTYTNTPNTLDTFIFAYDGTTGISVELPPANAHTGQKMHVKKVNNLGNVNIYPKPGDLVDGSGILFIVEQYTSISLISSGEDWWIV